MTTHETLAAALAAFQTEIPRIEKGKTANAGKYAYDYADLSDVTAVVLPLLGKHGLAWSAAPTVTDHGFVLEYQLAHVSGEAITGTYPLPAVSTPPQQMGSAITYARRYCLTAVTGVAPGGDDDDARAAQQAHKPATGPRRAPQPVAPPAEVMEEIKARQRELGLSDAQLLDGLKWVTNGMQTDLSRMDARGANALADYLQQTAEKRRADAETETVQAELLPAETARAQLLPMDGEAS